MIVSLNINDTMIVLHPSSKFSESLFLAMIQQKLKQIQSKKNSRNCPLPEKAKGKYLSGIDKEGIFVRDAIEHTLYGILLFSSVPIALKFFFPQLELHLFFPYTEINDVLISFIGLGYAVLMAYTKNMPIRIIDKTLSCLDSLAKPELLRFLNLLIKTEVDAIELSQKMNDLLSPLPEYPNYIIANNDSSKNRVCGFDDAMCGDYQYAFSQLRNSYGNNIEFCPGNSKHCATALAVEWIVCGGNCVVTSFGGIGGCAATEEVLMALRTKGLRKPEKVYDYFPEMAQLLGITNKPVIGEKIFHVESGVHVNGILKHSASYEPFPPEVVGLKRKIILGKHSGTASIKAMIEKLKLNCSQNSIPLILEQVKLLAEKKNRAITNQEFSNIATECQL